MAPKKKRKRKPNLRSRIVSLIVERGPRPQRGMTRTLVASYQSLNTEILELRRLGVLEKSDDGVLSLIQGVDLAQFGIEVPLNENPITTKTSASEATMEYWNEGDFTHQEKFVRLLRSVGVKQEIGKTICHLYFNGNVNSMRWLYQVLVVTAKGFVTEDQAKMIMPSWAYYWGVPYNHEDFFED
jgi:hypothetical protein